jgi:hypothetical protein
VYRSLRRRRNRDPARQKLIVPVRGARRRLHGTLGRGPDSQGTSRACRLESDPPRRWMAASTVDPHGRRADPVDEPPERMLVR